MSVSTIRNTQVVSTLQPNKFQYEIPFNLIHEFEHIKICSGVRLDGIIQAHEKQHIDCIFAGLNQFELL